MILLGAHPALPDTPALPGGPCLSFRAQGVHPHRMQTTLGLEGGGLTLLGTGPHCWARNQKFHVAVPRPQLSQVILLDILLKLQRECSFIYTFGTDGI